jgi:hypothetical protein
MNYTSSVPILPIWPKISAGVGPEARAIELGLQQVRRHGSALATRRLHETLGVELEEVYRLCFVHCNQAAAQRLLARLDGELRAARFENVDELLASLDVTLVGSSVLLTALSITSYARERLRARALFLARAEAQLRRSLGDARARALLAHRR